jgi:chromosome segregation ATPase
MMRAILVLAFFAAATVDLKQAWAADSQTETRLREALRSTTSQLRALEEEKIRWQATEAAQKNEIESLKAKLAEEGRKARARSASEELSRRLQGQTETNQKLSDSLAQCQASTRESVEAIRTKDAEREQLTEQVKVVNNRVTTCEQKNARMYQLSHEFLKKCEQMDLGENLIAPLEPFTGLRRTKFENIVQEYEDKLGEQKDHL